MPERSDAAVEAYVHEQWQDILVNRATAGIAVILAAVAAYAFASYWFGGGKHPVLYYFLILGLGAMQGGVLVALRRPGPRPHSRELVLTAACASCFLIAAAGAVAGRTTAAELLLVGYVMACAALLPWGHGPQLAFATTAMFAIGANSLWVTGAVIRTSEFPAFVAIVVLLAASVFVAYELEQSRNTAGREELGRKRAEDELRRMNADLERRVSERTSELQAAVQEIQSYSYSISHDLRAPLRGINGFSRALADEFGDALGQRGREYIERVSAASTRMGDMIDGLLALARVTRKELYLEEVDVTAMARAIAGDLEGPAPDRTIEWAVAPGVRAYADRTLLRLALQNLLANAFKFTMLQAEPRIEIGIDPGRPESTYFVRDNGVGFDMKYSDQLFGAFRRLHEGDAFGGTGAGLAAVHRIIRRHGGRIWAEAEPGHGATFFFTLSESVAEQAAAAETGANEPSRTA